MDTGIGAQDGRLCNLLTGKWHLGEADYALPNAQGFDLMKYCGLYHLNAYICADPKWFPDMSPELRAMFAKVTTGMLSGNGGEKPHEEFKLNGEYVNTPEQGAVGIPFVDEYIEKAALVYSAICPKESRSSWL